MCILILFLEVLHAIPCESVLRPGPARIPHTHLSLRSEGRDGSAITSVTVTSDGWKPEIRWVPVLPKK